MGDKTKGLYKRYEVKKLSNPGKVVDAIVLEFDDALERDGILEFAEIMLRAGYEQYHSDIIHKIDAILRQENTNR